MVVILLGLISVMIGFAMFLSKRVGQQAGIVTVIDRTQLARLYLESYAGDVLTQLRAAVNNFQDDNLDKIRDVIRGSQEGTIDPGLFYKKQSSMLNELDDRYEKYGVSLSGKECTITISQVKNLPYPMMLKNVPPVERAGELQMTCKVALNKKPYKMILTIPYKVVSCLTPFLKEFVAFFDKIGLEQTSPIGPADKLNILKVKASRFTDYFSGNGGEFCGMPLVINSFYDKPFQNGQIFLGPDDKEIFLNLAGENKKLQGHQIGEPLTVGGGESIVDLIPGKNEPSRMADLWQIDQSYFDEKTTVTGDPNYDPFDDNLLANMRDDDPINDRMAVFRDEKNNPVVLRTAKMESADKGMIAKFHFMGFSEESSLPGQGHLTVTERDLDVFLANDPAYKVYKQEGRKYLGVASSLKLRGLNGEYYFGKTYSGLPSFIYGKIFARFKLLSVVRAQGDISGIIPPLFYSEDENPQLEEIKSYQVSGLETLNYTFKPKGGRKYQMYMSRIVSGGGDPNKQIGRASCRERV